MDASENFYLLLDLDPDRHRSWADIEPALKAKRGEWSARSNHPRDGLEAKRCLGLVRRMESELKDDAKRKEHADAARGLRAAQVAQSAAALDDMLQVAAGKGYLTPDDVTNLTAQGTRGANRWTAADVQARVSAAKLTVKAAAPAPPPDPTRIPDATADTIRDNLKVLGKADLYDFLAAPRSAATAQLKALADAEDKAARLESVKDAKVTARMALVGFCLNLFGSDGERAKYNAALQWQELEEIRKFVEVAGTGEKRVPLNVVEDLVRRGRDQGIPRDRVLAAVQEVAQKRGWLVEVPGGGTELVANLKCGSCTALNDTTAANCRRCNRPLKVNCPKCGRTNPTDATACGEPKCLFAIGSMPLAEPRLDLARRIAQTDPAAARQQVNEALTFWPGHPQGVQLLADLDRREQQAKAELDRRAAAVDDARGKREYLRARAAVAELAHLAPQHPTLPAHRKEIDDAIAAADALVRQGQQFAQQGKADDALDTFLEAVRRCADLPAARDGVSRCPPDPPPSASPPPPPRA